MSALSKRLFYLMMSHTDGQEFASLMGFSTPSEEVVDAETGDILTRWAVMMHYGIIQEIQEASEWFAEFMEETDKLISEFEEFKSVLTVFGVALVNKIMEAEKLALVVTNGASK